MQSLSIDKGVVTSDVQVTHDLFALVRARVATVIMSDRGGQGASVQKIGLAVLLSDST